MGTFKFVMIYFCLLENFMLSSTWHVAILWEYFNHLGLSYLSSTLVKYFENVSGILDGHFSFHL